jgi:hypothetical protein
MDEGPIYPYATRTYRKVKGPGRCAPLPEQRSSRMEIVGSLILIFAILMAFR